MIALKVHFGLDSKGLLAKDVVTYGRGRTDLSV